MHPECHRLLKSSCALLGVSIGEFCYTCVAARFKELCKTDKRFLSLLMAESYPVGSRAYLLKEEFTNLQILD